MDYDSDIGSEDDDIFVDTIPIKVESNVVEPETKSKPKIKQKELPTADANIVKKMLSKAVLGSDFDQKPIEEVMARSNRSKRKARKLVRESTKGNKWYNMPATELTDENRRDLELLQIRGQIDPKAQYRKNDLNALPKYFQTGTVVDNAADYYSSRVPKKQRKQTMVDELMSDYKFLAKNKQRYTDIKAREAQTRRRRINPMKRFSKNKK